MIDTSYTFTKGELLLLYMKRQIKSRFIWLVIFFLVISTYIPLLQDLQKVPKNTWVTLLVTTTIANIVLGFFFYLFVLILLFLMGLWKIWNSRSAISSGIHYSFSPEKITSRSQYSKSEFEWKLINKINQDKNYFYLKTAKTSLQLVIPKRAFKSASDLKKFIAILQDKKLLVV